MEEGKWKLLLEKQLSEFEMLQAIYCNPGEIHVDDYRSIADITDYVNNKTNILPPCLDFKINFRVENYDFELFVTLPHEYPDVKPDLFVRNNEQHRNHQRQLNIKLSEYVNSLDEGDISIYSAVMWLQENAAHYMSVQEEPLKSNNNEINLEYARYWIYSHHIYSKTKRKEILSLASDYYLTGFCLPGKPGVICVEGCADNCNNWWIFIKSMTWKKIICKKIENITCLDNNTFRKFQDFQELSFPCEGNRSNHVNMKQFHKYLEEHDCIYIFNELFGLDAKNN